MNQPLNRRRQSKQVAKHLNKKLGSTPWLDIIVNAIRENAESLISISDDDLRASCYASHTTERQDFDLELVRDGASVFEAIRRVHGVELFDTQIRAGLIMALGGVAEMQTGEGKTFAGPLPTFFHAKRGGGVHVATPNAYLAQRDYELLSDVYQMLGLSCGLVTDGANDEEAAIAYRCDVTVAASHTFGFDHLRDAVVRRYEREWELGARFLRSWKSNGQPKFRQRRLNVAIIDEVDDVLLDDAISPLVLSGAPSLASSDDTRCDGEALRRAHEIASHLELGRHFRMERVGTAKLTRSGFETIYVGFQPFDVMKRTWHEYVESALQANHTFQRDVHYVVRDGKLQLVDGSTGRLFEDRTWSRGLHQAVEVKEGVDMTPESVTLARITKQVYYRGYRVLCGMTGTANGCEGELADVYGMPVIQVPTRLPTNRVIMPMRCFLTCDGKYQAVVDEAISMAQQGRAVLIGTLSVEESIAIASQLETRSQPHQILNGVQDADEACVVAAAGRGEQITVATNLAGRGTDIPLQDSVRQHGGLHVIVTQLHPLARVDRQLIGRGARCGDPGSARCFVSAEDSFLVDSGPWVAREILRVCHGGEAIAGPAIIQAIEKLQLQKERALIHRRADALHADADEQQWSTSNQESERPAECWAI